LVEKKDLELNKHPAATGMKVKAKFVIQASQRSAVDNIVPVGYVPGRVIYK
jgi:hypothetical protein